MVTGTLGLSVATTALTAGADDVLYKPIDLAVLAATVSKCVERRKASVAPLSACLPESSTAGARRTEVS